MNDSASLSSNPSAPPQRADVAAKTGRVARIEIICGIVCLLLTFYGFWRERALPLTFIHRNDGHCLLMLYSDLVSHEYSLQGWSLTPAPYFFPDMPVLFGAMKIAANAGVGYCLYDGLMLAVVFACYYLIAGFVIRSAAHRTLIVGWAALIFLLLCRWPNTSYWITAGWFLTPGGHGGGAVAGLSMIALAARLLWKPSKLGYVLFGIISFISAASDKLFVPHYLAPMLLAAFYLAWRHRSTLKPAIILGAIVVLVQLTSGRAVVWASRKFGFEVPLFIPPPQSLETLTRTWKLFAADVPRVAGLISPMAWLVALSIVGAIAVALWNRRRLDADDHGRDRQSNFIFVCIVAAVSCCGAIALPLVTSFWVNADCVRYLDPLLLFPPLVLVCAGAVTMARMPERSRAWLAIGPTVLLICFWVPVLKAPRVSYRQIFRGVPDVGFVDRVARKYHLHTGIGDYWFTKPVTLFNRSGVVLNELDFLDGHPKPRWWINNRNRWIHKPASQGPGYPIYDFALFAAQLKPDVEKMFGPAAAVEGGSGLLLYVYNRPEDVVFRNYFRGVATYGKKTSRRRVTNYKNLNTPKQSQFPWNGPGVTFINPKENLTLQFDRDGGGEYMEIGVKCDDTYELEFRHGAQRVGVLRTTPSNIGGINALRFSLLPVTGGKLFDSIQIHPIGGDGKNYSISHLLIYDDPLFHPDEGL